MKDRIKSVRTRHNLSQQAFADTIGITRQYLSLLENGEREPSDLVLNAISREYGINIAWLKTGEGERLRMQQSAMLIPQLHSILAGHPLLADALNAAVSVMREEDFRRLEEVIDQAVAVYTQKKEQP